MNRLLPLVTLILATGCSSPARERSAAPSAPPRYVDLTHELSSDSIFWPTGETFRLEKVADGITEKGYYYASNRFSGNEHGGRTSTRQCTSRRATGRSIRFRSTA